MMKKLNISSQLFVIFIGILLIASLSFSVITLASVNDIAEEQVYSRLNSYAGMLNPMNPRKDEEAYDNKDTPLELKDMNVGYRVVYRDREEPFDKGITSFITEGELESLINKYVKEDTINFNIQGSTKTSIKRIFYVIKIFDSENYTIIVTDTEYTDDLIEGISIRLIIAFLIIILLTIALILLWSNRFVRRVNKLQNHILSLPKNKYKESYVDPYKDEIGKLALSVDEMRIEISKNEDTKQEMLQNISHDFKTPIAVIKSYAEAMQDNVMGEEALQTIIEQTDILKHKVERLLQYNSLEYLDNSKPFEDVCINEIMSEIVTQYKLQTDINIEMEYDNETFYKGYRENWYTVISNIVDNAKRYAKSTIKLSLKKGVLTIFNDGEPIDEQFVNNSFKPYEKGSKGQFGLGMSIVQKTVYFFGYNMKVINEPTGGVSFIINK